MSRDPRVYLDDLVVHAERAIGYLVGVTRDQLGAEQPPIEE